MNILNAKLLPSNKRERIIGGLYIEFLSIENVSKNTFFEIEYKDKSHYFISTNIEIEGEILKITALEVGYYMNLLNKNHVFDIRTIIGVNIEKVENTETISKIREMMCWC